MLKNKEIRGTARECCFPRDDTEILHKAARKPCPEQMFATRVQKATGRGRSHAQFQRYYIPAL